MRFVNQFFICPKDDSVFLLEGELATGPKFNGGAYCPVTDRIYLAPWSGTQICEIDPNTDTWSLVGPTITGLEKFSGFVYVGGGKMVGIPLSYSQPILFDTVTKSVTPFGTSNAGLLKWYGGALGNNGFVYAAPFNGASQFLKIDPVGLTTSLVGASITGPFRLSGMSQIGENLFLAANRNYTHPVLFDANTDTWTDIGSSQPTTLNKYWSTHALKNGRSYITKCNSSLYGEINNTTLALEFFGVSESMTNRNYGMGFAPNGNFYTTPASSNYIEKFEPGSDNRKLIATPITGSEKYLGSPILAPNGCFYFAPFLSRRIMKLLNIGTATSSMFTFPGLTDFHLSDWNIYQNRY